MDEFEVERVLDQRQVHCGCVWVDEYLVKWVGYGLFEATWEPSAHLANAPTALADFLATRDGLPVRTRISQGGGDVRFCCLVLFVYCCIQRCRCSLSLHLCVRMLCMFCVHAAYVFCVWGKPTKGVRTIDSFRVNSLNGW